MKGVSPTESGLQTLALLAGVILSSIVSGILVSRTGRYKWLITGALAVMTLGLFLLTGLTSTHRPARAVGVDVHHRPGHRAHVRRCSRSSSRAWCPSSKLGVATGNLTFFRQIGGSVGLAIVGTLFGQRSRRGSSRSWSPPASPEVGPDAAFAAAGSSADELTAGRRRVGSPTSSAAFLPADLIPKVVDGIHQAFSLAIADTFWFGLGATLIALVVTVVALPELPLRGFDRATQPGGAPATGQASGPITDAQLGVAE